MDNTDLIIHTDNYVKSCTMLDEAYKNELAALTVFKEAERKVHLENFPKVQNGDLSNTLYREMIKHDVFSEKLDYETAKVQRKMAQNRESALKERLYTLKKQISIG